jgi:hypothetical protein
VSRGETLFGHRLAKLGWVIREVFVKEWILYCVLCSLIYAMIAQAEVYQQPELTAEVFNWKNQRLSVLDCAVFIPNMDEIFGEGSTARIKNDLKIMGYKGASVSPNLTEITLSQADDAGHRVTEFYTDRDLKALDRYGKNTLYLTLSGLRSSILKKHMFILSLYVVGKPKAIAISKQTGTLGQVELKLSDLPYCRALKNPK